MKNAFPAILVTATVLLGLLTIPSASATTFEVGFEEFTAGDTDPENADFTFSQLAASSFVSTAQANTGTKSLKYTATSSGNHASIIPNSADLCQGSSTVWVFMDAYPDVGDNLLLIWSDQEETGSPGNNYVYARIEPDGSLILFVEGTAGGVVDSETVPSMVPLSTWVDLTYSADCATGQGSIFSSVMDDGVSAQAAANTDPLDVFTIHQLGATAGPTIYIDDVSWEDGVEPSFNAFCADPNEIDFEGVPEADYGYAYRRGGDFFDQSGGDNPEGIGLSTGFFYSGTSSESSWDYSAKDFLTPSKALHQNLTMEAGTDGTSSSFRVNFILSTGTDADATTKGNGLTTGHFTRHVEAQFEENGNTWRITFWYVDSGSRTQMGSSVNFGDSNDATNFVVWIDTRATASVFATLDDEHADDYTHSGIAIHQPDPFIMVTTASAANGPNGEEISVLAIRYLDDIAGNPFLDDDVGHLWNVGAGTSALLFGGTAIDENNQENRANTDDEGGLASTCIFDDAGTLVFDGSQGGTPETFVPPPGPGGDDETPPGQIDFGSPEINFLAGILLLISLVFMGIEKGAGNVGLALIAIIGLGLAYAIGWIPLGFLILLMVLAIAALWFMPGLGGGKADGGL